MSVGINSVGVVSVGVLASSAAGGGGGGGFNAAWARWVNSLLKVTSMKKNAAGQKIGVQMVSATDGSAFSGSVTVYVTVDAGTQAIGSVGSGACTHEGNGYHTYAPAQAETNGDLLAFTFIGTGAVPATVQVYPSFPQTTDNQASLPNSGALTTIQADLDDIQTRLPAALGANGNLKVDVRDFNGVAGTFSGGRPEVNTTHAAGTAWNSGAIGAATLAADTITAAKIAADAIGASELAADAVAEIADAVWDEAISGHLTAGSTGNALNAAGSAGDPWSTPLPGAYGAGTAGKIVGDNINATISSRSTLDAAGVRTAVGLASANLDTQLGTLATAANLATVAGYLDTEVAAIKAVTDALSPRLPGSGTLATTADVPTAVANADALLGRNVAGGSSSGRLVKEAFYALRNRWTSVSGVYSVYQTDDTTVSWTSTLSTDAAAVPLVGSDPA